MASVCLEVSDELVEFILCRSSISLKAFANETEPREGDTREINRFDLDGQAVDRSGVSKNKFYKADVDTEGHRSGTLGGALTTKTNEPFAVERC
ncbi:hypothetical protein NKI46_07430 [Mesorhizobium sp. M0615]|uniref:hypothetical protein n=1 Tax=Mesorhizobium sp. M0615 TaxID=2956971 RepID=UPI00333A51C3